MLWQRKLDGYQPESNQCFRPQARNGAGVEGKPGGCIDRSQGVILNLSKAPTKLLELNRRHTNTHPSGPINHSS